MTEVSVPASRPDGASLICACGRNVEQNDTLLIANGVVTACGHCPPKCLCGSIVPKAMDALQVIGGEIVQCRQCL